MKKKDRSKKTGSARMIEQGCRQVQLWLDSQEYKLIKQAAESFGLPVATWVRRIAFKKAGDLIGKPPPPKPNKHDFINEDFWERVTGGVDQAVASGELPDVDQAVAGGELPDVDQAVAGGELPDEQCQDS